MVRANTSNGDGISMEHEFCFNDNQIKILERMCWNTRMDISGQHCHDGLKDIHINDLEKIIEILGRR